MSNEFVLYVDTYHKSIALQFDDTQYKELTYGPNATDDEIETLIKMWVDTFNMKYDGEWRYVNNIEKQINLIWK